MGVSGREAYKSTYYKVNLRHTLGEEKVPRCSMEGERGSSGENVGRGETPGKPQGKSCMELDARR